MTSNCLCKETQHGTPCTKRPPDRIREAFCVFAGMAYLRDSATATATLTVAPTMGLLPMPKKPIIST